MCLGSKLLQYDSLRVSVEGLKFALHVSTVTHHLNKEDRSERTIRVRSFKRTQCDQLAVYGSDLISVRPASLGQFSHLLTCLELYEGVLGFQACLSMIRSGPPQFSVTLSPRLG